MQFACTNLEGYQKEGVIFKFASERRKYPERGRVPQKRVGSNPGGNCGFQY